MYLDNPNSVFWNEHIGQAKRSNTQLYVGKIVDTQNDGNYKSNILQQYSVRIMGWGVVVPNCKVATQVAGYNGAGHYTAYQKGDAVICMSKEGSIDELIILGSVRMNGNHEEFINKGQGLRPGELTPAAKGPALANQASLHPSRVTKPDSEFYLMGVNNIKAEYEDPVFGDEIETLAEMQPLVGIVQSRGRGGVLTNYAYGGIVNYTDGNNVIVSGGTSENKCTRMLKAAKRHAEIAKMLSTVTGVKIEDVEEPEEVIAEETEIVKALPTSSNRSVNIKSSESFIDSEKKESTADEVEKKLENNTNNVNSSLKVTQQVQSFVGESAMQSRNEQKQEVQSWGREEKGETDGRVTPLYREEEHLKLAKRLVELAQKCNIEAASMQQQAGVMADAYGNHLGQGGQPRQTTEGASPIQEVAYVHPRNKAKRSILPGCEGHILYEEAPEGELVSVGNNQRLRKTAAEAFKKMQAAAKKDGVNIFVLSGFRSIAQQKEVFFSTGFSNKDKPTEEEYKERCRYSAPPGYSEHATGFAADFNSVETSFEQTKEYKWLKENSKKFGWELSFGKDQKLVGFEPWHYRFVGV